MNKTIDCYRAAYAANEDIWSQQEAMRSVINEIIIEQTSWHRVLDIGCGRGADLERLLDHAHEAIGVEPIETLEMKSLVKKAKGRLTHLIDLFPSDKIEGTFDLILDNGCLHHEDINNFPKYFEKINQISLSNTVFYLNVFRAPSKEQHLNTYLLRDGRQIHLFHEDVCGDFFCKFGWLVQKQIKIPNPDFRFKYLLLKLTRSKV